MKIYNASGSFIKVVTIKPSLAKIAAGDESLSDVWNLESKDEETAAQILSQLVNKALAGDQTEQQYLSGLWDGESWDSIQKKVMAEGSTWYVWWMDGVRKFMSQMDTKDVEDVEPEGELATQPDASASCKSCLITEAKCNKCKNRKGGPPYTWMPKDKTHSGHMDSQMYPECASKWCDRDIVKNHKHCSFNLNKFLVEAKKKKKKWNPNPWAVCNTTVDKDKSPAKFERCVQKIKKQQT